MSDEWKRVSKFRFRHRSGPWQVKYRLEKVTLQLLDRQTVRPKLKYSGADRSDVPDTLVTLVFENAYPEDNQYSLSVVFSAPANYAEEAERLFRKWTTGLEGAVFESSEASPTLYREAVREALRQESEDSNRPDESSEIDRIQQRIVASLQGGQSFRENHHEGGSSLYFDQAGFVKSTYGVEKYEVRFGTQAELFAFLREHYLYRASSPARPHRPSEVEIWSFIEQQLSPARASGPIKRGL